MSEDSLQVILSKLESLENKVNELSKSFESNDKKNNRFMDMMISQENTINALSGRSIHQEEEILDLYTMISEIRNGLSDDN